MNQEEKKTLNEFLSKTLKIDEEQLATLYNEAGDLTGLQVAFDADASRVKQFQTEKTNQYNRGLKEGATKIEKEIKSKYEVESEAIGVELVDSIVLSKIEEATKGVAKDITKHPGMIAARTEWEKEQKQRDKDWQTKLDAKDAEFVKNKLKEKVRSKGLLRLDEFKPILSEDVRKAANLREVYINDILSFDYQEQDDDFVVLDKDGSPLKDAHGYTIKFDGHAKNVSDKYFDYPKSEDRSSAGNKDTGQKQTGSFVPPKTEEEYNARLKNPNITPDERIELVTNWNNKGKK